MINTMRVCNVCKQSKALNEFYKDKRAASGFGYRCIECDKAKAMAQYDKKKEALERLTAPARARGCVICGIKTPEVIQFHHVEKKGKDWRTTLGPLEEAKAELRKCVPLCANCHLQVHAGTAILPTDAQRVLP